MPLRKLASVSLSVGCAECPACACALGLICEYGPIDSEEPARREYTYRWTDWEKMPRLAVAILSHVQYAAQKGNPCTIRVICVKEAQGWPVECICCCRGAYEELDGVEEAEEKVIDATRRA